LLYELLVAAVGKAYIKGAVYYGEHYGELENTLWSDARCEVAQE